MNFFKQSKLKSNIYFFLLASYFCVGAIFNSYSLEASNEKPDSLDFHQDCRKVVYTSICGNYDSLVSQSYMPKGWDYICFTDNQELLEKGHPQWTIRPLSYTQRDKTRNSRWHKMFPHLILPEYEISFYIDANINIKDSRIFDYIDRELLADESEILAINKHPIRNCIYQEAEECKFFSLDSAKVIDRQIAILRSFHYPESNGLVDSSMIYRRHHDEKVQKLMEGWWFWISTCSKRDQLSFNFVMWLQQFKAHLFKKQFSHNPEYADFLKHRGKATQAAIVD